jgi:SAM-dependent methyltransferase
MVIPTVGIPTQFTDLIARRIGITDLRAQLSQQIERLSKLEIERNNLLNLFDVERTHFLSLREIDRNNVRNLMDLVTRLASENQALTERLARRHSEAMTALINTREHLVDAGGARRPLSSPIIKAVKPLEAVWTEFERRAPRVFSVWKAALDIGTQSYEGFPVGSCSVAGHAEAELFRKFLLPYSSGNLLDVGCGPQPMPHYLRDCAIERVFGIDPISHAADHPFNFIRGVAEFLPWADAQFDTVIAATTLDHFLLLDVGVAEVHRVLRQAGHFVAWIAVFEGAPSYDPYALEWQPADGEHLFHLDPVWFEPMMAEHFNIRERFTFDLPFPFAFYAFQKK